MTYTPPRGIRGTDFLGGRIEGLDPQDFQKVEWARQQAEDISKRVKEPLSVYNGRAQTELVTILNGSYQRLYENCETLCNDKSYNEFLAYAREAINRAIRITPKEIDDESKTRKNAREFAEDVKDLTTIRVTLDKAYLRLKTATNVTHLRDAYTEYEIALAILEEEKDERILRLAVRSKAPIAESISRVSDYIRYTILKEKQQGTEPVTSTPTQEFLPADDQRDFAELVEGVEAGPKKPDKCPPTQEAPEVWIKNRPVITKS